MEITLDYLIDKLQILKDNHNIVGVKQSFEDEGAMLEDVLTMRRITESINIKLSVKIGGCEAISDINNSVDMNVNGIVAPMIETDFALQKYVESIQHIKGIKFYINVESKHGYENLDKILNSPSANLLEGIVIGRSDLTKSYGHSKDFVDSDMIQKVIEEILVSVKDSSLKTLMGGNINPKSSKFINEMYNKKLLDGIETRNLIITLNDNNIDNLDNLINDCLSYEKDWLQYKAQSLDKISHKYKERIETLNNRLF